MADSDHSFGFDVSLVVLTLGAILIACSFLPMSFLSKSVWTTDDSRALGHVSQELHGTRVTAFATEEEQNKYHQKLQIEFEKLRNKLEHAQHEPQRWSQIFLWTGVGLTAVGAIAHLAKQNSD